MPMLHGCSFPGCDTLTLSVHCFEHELLIRAEIEDERMHAAARNEPTAREPAAEALRTSNGLLLDPGRALV